jgi:mannosyltransferase
LSPVLSRAKVFHSSLFRIGLGRSLRNVVTIHDLTYEKGLVPGARARVGLAQRRLAVRSADGLIFVSETTRKSCYRFYPEAAALPFAVAWHGRDPSWDKPDEAPHPTPAGPNESYLLHVGHRDGYKNFNVALDGYAESSLPSAQIQFVILGPPLSDSERSILVRRRLSHLVVWRTAPTRAVLRRYLTGAYALTYVSREEGFGMPIVEAMQCACPVIAADATCLPEIAGGAALLVDPNDPRAVAAAIDQLADSGTRARLVELGRRRAMDFCWTTSIMKHIELYELLADRM